MSTRPDPADLVLMGTIGTPRGVRGDIRIKTFTESPADIAAYGPLWDKAAARSFQVRVIEEIKSKDQVVARIEGIADRTAAEGLKGIELYVPRDALPEAEDDTFYYVDLIGLRAETTEGEFLGEVRTVSDFGAGDLLEIGGGPYRGLVVPFTAEVVPEVDLEGGRLVVDPPDGLLDPPEDDAKPKTKTKRKSK